MTETVEWFFGRGLSIGCGLTWSVPVEWTLRPRDEQIARIKSTITAEMDADSIDTADIRYFFDLIAKHTAPSWLHQFHTTNWDYLLQREILALDFKVQPDWCASTHVFHLNGTVEPLENESHRSKFVLESDPINERVASTEENVAFNKFIWSRTFVVIGMSFECEVDKYLLSQLNRVQDDLPIGESRWIVVNPNLDALATTCERLKKALPRSEIVGNASTFRGWIKEKMPELQARGAIFC